MHASKIDYKPTSAKNVSIDLFFAYGSDPGWNRPCSLWNRIIYKVIMTRNRKLIFSVLTITVQILGLL